MGLYPHCRGKERKLPRYYLLDELGCPLRVQYATGKGECYGYDEFGQDLAEEKREVSQEDFGSPYVKQGSTQPFGYTGYCYDGNSGSYFAQAREYQPHTGRAMAEDVIRGKLSVPKTLNRYGYCLGNPIRYVDLDGKTETEAEYTVYYLNNMDGAKIFGHNALLIENPDGSSQFYTYTGTGSITDALSGKDSLGYMGSEQLTKEETKDFLRTGNIEITMPGGVNVDNYDRALVREITQAEREIIVDEAEAYVSLYKSVGEIREDIKLNVNEKEEAVKEFMKNNPMVVYNMYSHNCDTVVRDILITVEPSLFLMKPLPPLTPNASYNSFLVQN